MAIKIQIRGDTAATGLLQTLYWLKGNQPLKQIPTVKGGQWCSTWSALPYAYYISDQLATESAAGLVEAATLAEIVALTDVGVHWCPVVCQAFPSE